MRSAAKVANVSAIDGELFIDVETIEYDDDGAPEYGTESVSVGPADLVSPKALRKATGLHWRPEELEALRAALPPDVTVPDIELESFNLDELRELLTTELPYLVKGLIVRGQTTLLTGREKAGKSTFLAAMFAAMAAGTEFLGLPTRKSGALWVTEENPATLVDKGDLFGFGNVEFVPPNSGFTSMPWERILHDAFRLAEQYGKELVVIDTLQFIADIKDENSNEIGNAVKVFRKAVLTTGLAGLIIHHQAKSGGSRGHTSLPGVTDINVELRRPDGKPTRKRYLVSVSRMSADALDMTIELVGDEYKVLADAKEELPGFAARYLQALTELDGDATKKSLADKLGHNAKTVERNMAKLEEHGVVEQLEKEYQTAPLRWRVVKREGVATLFPDATSA